MLFFIVQQQEIGTCGIGRQIEDLGRIGQQSLPAKNRLAGKVY